MLDFIAYKIDRFRFYIRLNTVSTQLLLLLPLILFLYEKHTLAIVVLSICLLIIIVSRLGKRGSKISNYIRLQENDYDGLQDEYYLFLEKLNNLDLNELEEVTVVNTSSLFIQNYIKYLIHKKTSVIYKFIVPAYIFGLLVLLFSIFLEVREGLRVLIWSVVFGILLWSPIFIILLLRLEKKDIYESFEGSYPEFEEFEMTRLFNSDIIDKNTYEKYMEIETKS